MSEPLKGNALIVGINAYKDGVKPLQSAAADARALADTLRDHHAYEVKLLLDSQADAASIFRALESEYLKSLEENTAFLLYFAGHGVARGDGSEGPQGYLLPFDATLGDQDTWMPMDRLRTALEALPSKHLLVILDCCFAGSFRWASTRDVLVEGRPLFDSQYERYLQGTAWQALTSASHNQVAMDISPGYANTRDGEVAGRHSPFALALINGLAGNADSSRGGHEPDGVITATELFQYAFEEFCGGNAPVRQTPGIWPLRPDNTGEYIFLNPRLPRKTLPDPPLDETNNPWMGLNAYASDQAPLFFGREKCVTEIVDRIITGKRSGLVAVIGASGTGKSSVVKAGVLPRLEHPPQALAARIGHWAVVRLARLGADPVSVLHKALGELGTAPPHGGKLLFIDQFEELYTRCHDQERREKFLAGLKELIDGTVTVVLTLRSDFEPQPADSAALGDVWKEARIVVPAFSADEFRECIEGPAAVKAVYFEPQALVGELVDEVMAMPGALPMLSFALAEMYRCAQRRRRRSGSNDRALTREDYQATGGVVGALHGRASALFDESAPAVQATIQRVFLRMVAQDGARISRRRVSLEELDFADAQEQARVNTVVEEYVAARLLVIDGKEIEPAHDTLIVAWKKLLDWLSEAGPQNLYRSLWHAAKGWSNRRRNRGMLWHDNPLLPLALANRDKLNALENRFVKASDKRRKRRRKMRLSIAGIVILGAFFALYLVGDSALEAEKALNTRDVVYLDIMEEGSFFNVEKVLESYAMGGVVQPADDVYGDWRRLIEGSDCGGYDSERNLVLPAASSNSCPFAIGRIYGKGRVMAIGHEALMTYIDWSNLKYMIADSPTEEDIEQNPGLAEQYAAQGYGESVFVDLALKWLVGFGENDDAPIIAGDENTPTITFSTGHEEAFFSFDDNNIDAQLRRVQQQGYAINTIEDFGEPFALASTDVLVIGNAWAPFNANEVAEIQRFVEDGGGLLMAGLGWSWIQSGRHGLERQPPETPAEFNTRALAVYPMNQLAEAFNARWTESPIWPE